MNARLAFVYGMSDAMNRRNYADTIQCKTWIRQYYIHYDRGWHSTRNVLHKRKESNHGNFK